MTSSCSLDDVYVIVTRAADRAHELVRGIQVRGGIPVSVPLIDVIPLFDTSVQVCVNQLSHYDGLVVTSANAIRSLQAAATREGVVLGELGLHCFAVGHSTARAVNELGWRATTPDGVTTAQGLGRFLASHRDPSVQTLLLPRGQLADESLPDMLRQAGYTVTPLVCYETVPTVVDTQRWMRILDRREIVVVTLFSPSAAHTLMVACVQQFHQAAANVKIACVGQTTADAVIGYGLQVDFMATHPSTDGVLDAICQGLTGSRTSL